MTCACPYAAGVELGDKKVQTSTGTDLELQRHATAMPPFWIVFLLMNFTCNKKENHNVCPVKGLTEAETNPNLFQATGGVTPYAGC